VGAASSRDSSISDVEILIRYVKSDNPDLVPLERPDLIRACSISVPGKFSQVFLLSESWVTDRIAKLT
jgi:hypothetical protein